MGLFNFKKDKVEKNESNEKRGIKIDVNSLNLLDQWSRQMAMVYKGDAYKDIEVFITQDKLIDRYGDKAEYSVQLLYMVLDYAVRNNKNIILIGLLPEDIIIESSDLKPLENDIDSICILTGYLEEKINFDKFIELFSDKEVFFIGEFLKGDGEKIISKEISIHTLKHVSGNYESIPVFINYEHALKYNRTDCPITKSTLKNILHFWNIYGIIIEPQEKYWVEISLEDTQKIYI